MYTGKVVLQQSGEEESVTTRHILYRTWNKIKDLKLNRCLKMRLKHK